MLNLQSNNLSSLGKAVRVDLPSKIYSNSSSTNLSLPPMKWRVKQWFKNLLDGSFFIPTYAKIARKLGLAVVYSELYGEIVKKNGEVVSLGLLGRRVITDAGVAYIANDFNAASGSADVSNFKYHGYGTGTTAEAAGQTALVTELTTEYVVNSTRPTGSQASSTNTYTTVATLTPDSGGTLAITEHGIFSASSSGTMLDRTKFSAVNLDSTLGDSLQTTYVLTLPSGS